MKNRIIAFLLIITSLFSLSAIYASAASGEEYISEVSVVYADSIEEAKAAIEGTEWKIYEKNLNTIVGDVFNDDVYLIYQTSTNVEDAITDLRVMDMYGGYSTSNYKNQLEASRQEYLKSVSYIRAAAEEFKTLYNAGDDMAEIAYRQLNYYRDSDTNTLMGDFLLNIPNDEALVTVLMEGNGLAVTNLVTLLAVGLSGGKTFIEKLTETYAIKDSLTDLEYWDRAEAVTNELMELATIVKQYDALAEDYDINDENMTEEEAEFITEYAAIALILEQIPYGEETLKDFIARADWEIKDLYPIVAALSEGQMALAEMGVLTIILQYCQPSASVEDLYAVLEETEKELTDENGILQTFDVYTGVDRSIFDGNFAFTSAAERQQAITGTEWSATQSMNDAVPYPMIKAMMISGVSIAFGPIAVAKILKVTGGLYGLSAAGRTNLYGRFCYYVLSTLLGTTKNGSVLKIGLTGITKYCAAVGASVLVVALGVIGVSMWYGYYHPDYTPIPDAMVDVRETDVGDKYIKYTAAKVYNDEDGRNADLNAYQGKEWNALYYTKDATAGKCLTPKFVYSETDSTIARRHQGISMFGESEAFNLNSHVYDKNINAIYVTIRYSTAKKAAADVPTVVGSMFADGAIYALTALGGAAVGVGATFAIGALKKKKEEPEEAEG